MTEPDKAPEFKRGWVSSIKLFLVMLLGMISWRAGRGNELFGIKWKIWGTKIMRLRRSIHEPLLLTGVCMILSKYQGSFSWWYLTCIPLYAVFMKAFAYGGSSFLRPIFGKFFQRVIVGLMWAVPALPFAWINGSWFLYGIHLVLNMIAHATLGYKNPIHAVEEETLLGVLRYLLVPFMLVWRI